MINALIESKYGKHLESVVLRRWCVVLSRGRWWECSPYFFALEKVSRISHNSCLVKMVMVFPMLVTWEGKEKVGMLVQSMLYIWQGGMRLWAGYVGCLFDPSGISKSSLLNLVKSLKPVVFSFWPCDLILVCQMPADWSWLAWNLSLFVCRWNQLFPWWWFLF